MNGDVSKLHMGLVALAEESVPKELSLHISYCNFDASPFRYFSLLYHGIFETLKIIATFVVK